MENSRCSFPALSKLTPEDQTQHESNSKRREYCLRWIFTDVFLGVFLECTGAARGVPPGLFRFVARIAPSLFRFSSVFIRKSACGGFQIFRCFTSMVLAALQFILRIGVSRRCLLSWFIFFCHW